MRLIAAFLRMVRLPNLIFIALTQLLFQYCIYLPLYEGDVPARDSLQFFLIMAASVCIAAGGYIINDYFDLNIDQVNKPDKIVVDKIIRRRWAIAWHLLLSLAGVLLTYLAFPDFSKWYLLLANIFCVFLLWFYSTNFKKSLLVGNVVISLLTAWSILILFFAKVGPLEAIGATHPSNYKFFRFAFLYAGFAFIISLVREAIKDMEDLEGDARYGCRTMPVVWGINTTRVYAAVWLVVLIAAVLVIQVYVLQFKWWAVVAYSIPAIIVPMIVMLIKLYRAANTSDFRQLSNLAKLVMLTGILSMILIYFYL